jgi:hypothetical protein
VGFSMIWLALLVYSIEGVRFNRSQKSNLTLVEPL